MICFECGYESAVKKDNKGISIFNSEEEIWQSDCPSCGCVDFYIKGEEYRSHK